MTKITFGRAVKSFFKGYFDFSGKTTRAGFWFAGLFLAIIFVPILLLFDMVEMILSQGIIIADDVLYNPFYYLLALGILAFSFPTLTMIRRRMADTGISIAWHNFILILIFLTLALTMIYGNQSSEIWQTFALFMAGFFLLVAIFIFSILPTGYFNNSEGNPEKADSEITKDKEEILNQISEWSVNKQGKVER
ncbi:MAG: DUF805 domain-containing protein [Streptococcaceae bacterium]|jgi:uncharacterized membrane protein YhaH (DUF805 family)|nr:DUF805 domain-containing protein [Streptococcaceae bacterium]